MNKLPKYLPPFIAGLVLNLLLMMYVYFFVEGGPVSLQQGGSWMEIFNEVPQTILIFMVAVVMPYFMLWSRRDKIGPTLPFASMLMLGATVVSGALIASAHEAMMREITMDIGWLALWGIGIYFALIPPATGD